MLLILRSANSVFSTDTTTSFANTLPASVLPPGPFTMRLANLCISVSTDSPVQVDVSLGAARDTYDVNTGGPSSTMAVYSSCTSGVIQETPMVTCLNSGTDNLVRVTLRNPNTQAVLTAANVNYAVIVLQLDPLPLK